MTKKGRLSRLKKRMQETKAMPSLIEELEDVKIRKFLRDLAALTLKIGGNMVFGGGSGQSKNM